jgi:hypothetical protein
LSLDYKNSDDEWQSLSKILVKDSIGAIKFKLNGSGSYTYRTSSIGGGNYSEFQSNSATVAFIQTSTSNSSTSTAGRPAGKVDRKSNSYKLMYNVGKNLARVSTPSDSAKSQCTSAKNTGFIKQNGRMNHLGSQYSFIQSHLRTASGYQGCIDGFNSL